MPEYPGSTVLVTGAGSGIGRATAHHLANDGCKVLCADVVAEASERVAREVGGQPLCIDVSDLASVREAVDEADRVNGGIDMLVTCAGWDRIERFLDSSAETWRRVIDVNLVGTINCIYAVLPGMASRKRGSIVCVSSDAGRVGSSGEVVYSGAKAGVIGFAKGIAREHARDGIRVNIVCPGPTNTPMMAQTAAADPRLADALVKAIPFRRLAEPHEIGAAIAFLLSNSSSYITGQTLSVNGGLSMV
jgi:2-hydroxycyclohexanecarboxyl-CoA dehydrogenase